MQACVEAFEGEDEELQTSGVPGGTTATVAVVCGWQLLVANVGDSLAMLDTGPEVLQVWF